MKVQFNENERVNFLTDSAQLNEALGGYGIESGNLVVIQAPTGEGKTTMMMRLAIKAAKDHKVAYISCGEQELDELSIRFARMIDRQEYKGCHRDCYTPKEIERILGVGDTNTAYQNIELYYEEYDLCKIVKQAYEDGAQFVFIDYLGCIIAPTQDKQYAFLAKLASWLKNFASKHNVGIITAMQTNRMLLKELKEPEFDPETINEEFMASSTGVALKATVCITWFRRKGIRYLTVFKNRPGSEKLSIQLEVEKYSYKWTEFFKPEAGF